MNLDALKQVWQEQNVGNVKNITQQELVQILNKPSLSPVAKMKRNLKTELVFVLISFSSMVVYYYISFGWHHVFVPITYVLFAILFLFYYQYKMGLLNRMLCTSCHIKSNISLQVNTLEILVKNYLVVGTMICTAAIVFIFCIEYYLSGSAFLNSTLLIYNKGNSVILYVITWLILILCLNQLIYWANKWYLNKLYGQHITRLKELLNQLEEE